jgi:MHS family proline/betaine transporter-like MFS transporter
MGCLPTYEQLGISATLLLVLMRLIQGLAVGGELVGAYIYTLEAANGKNKGFWGSIIDYINIYIFFFPIITFSFKKILILI